MYRLLVTCLSVFLISGCLATKAVTTTAGVAVKATVVTVKTTAKVGAGTADLLIPDGEDKSDEPEDQP